MGLRFAALCALGWVVGGCGPGDADGDKVNQVVVLGSTSGPEHCGDITADETWAADRNPHVITCHVNIEGGTVTIGRGTIVAVESYYSISVGYYGGAGALVVGGLPEDPVTFTGADAVGPGAWGRLGFYEGNRAADTRISNAIVEEAGYVAFPTVPRLGVTIDATSVLVDGLTIRDTVDYGFGLQNGGTFAPGSRNLVSTGSAYPGRAEADVAHSVPEQGIDLTGNDTDGLLVAGNTIAADVRWDDLGVPYLVDAGNRIDLEGTAGAPARLTLGPGTEIRFAASKNIAVSTYGGPAALAIAGTAQQPVLLRGLGAAGLWDGLYFGPESVDSWCTLAGFDIGFGGNGSYNYGNLHLSSASPTIAGAFVHDSASYGIYLTGDSAPALSGVTYANNTDGDLYP